MRKLTSKQEKFVQELIKGSTKADAYRNAGYNTVGVCENSIYVSACQLFKNPKIMQRYDELMRKSEEQSLWTRQRATDTLVDVINECKKALTRETENDDGGKTYLVDSKLAAQIINAVGKLNDMNGFNEQTVNQKTDGNITVDITVTNKVSK